MFNHSRSRSMYRRPSSFGTGRSSALASEFVAVNVASSSSRATTKLHTVLLTYAAIEFLAVAWAAYLAGTLWHFTILNRMPSVTEYSVAALSIAGLILSISGLSQNFTAIQRQPRHVFLWKATITVALAFSIFLTALFLTHFTEFYSRGTFIAQIIFVGVTVATARMLFYSWLQNGIASHRIEARRVFLVSDDSHTSDLIERLDASGIKTVGVSRLNGGEDTKRATSAFHELLSQVRLLQLDDIIMVASAANAPTMLALASELSELPIGVHFIPVDITKFLSVAQVVDFGNLRTVQLYRRPLSAIELAIKRIFDVVTATAGLILLSPLFLVVSIAIKLDSPGPILFQQKRHGFNNKIIRVFKFRSMTSIEDGDKFNQALENDVRVTRVGQIIRRTNIDELPQLINVIRGDMSIVGPRPHATAHNLAFQNMIKPFSRRHVVKPGITGWAQVNGYRGATDTLEKMRRRIEYDLYYVDNWSFMLDMKIILLTLFSKAAYRNAY
jgi:Undecaprenyl-phosphate glucose phosphotransferase